MGLEITSTTYNAGEMTQENSLVANLLKYPEINRTVIDLYPKYTMTWLFEKLERFGDRKSIKDDAYEYKTLGRLEQPAFATGTYKANASGSDYAVGDLTIGQSTATDQPVDLGYAIDDNFTLEFHETGAQTAQFLHPNMLVRLKSGAQVVVTGSFAGQNANTVRKVVKVTKGPILESDLIDGAQFSLITPIFGEGSFGSYGNNVYEATERQWVTTIRVNQEITGDAYTNASWLKYKGERMWFFDQEMKTERRLNIYIERMLRLASRTRGIGASASVSEPGAPSADNLWPGGNAGYTIGWDSNDPVNKRPPSVGDGLFEQISDLNVRTYSLSTGLTENFLADYIAWLGQQSPNGNTGNEWLVLASAIGRRQIQKALRELGWKELSGGSFYNPVSGKDVNFGSGMITYESGGNKISVIDDMVLNDPNVYGFNSEYGLNGTGDMIFLDFSMVNGMPNMQLMSKNQRSYIKKYIKGMMDPFDPSSMTAQNSYDGFSIEWLANLNVVLHNKYSCGILRAVA